MMSRAAQTHLAGHMRPAGRVFETPALQHRLSSGGPRLLKDRSAERSFEAHEGQKVRMILCRTSLMLLCIE